MIAAHISGDGLRRHTQQRSQHTHRKIDQAIRDLPKKSAPINVNAVACHAGGIRNQRSKYQRREHRYR